MDSTSFVYCYVATAWWGYPFLCVWGSLFYFVLSTLMRFVSILSFCLFEKEKGVWLGIGRRSAMTHTQKCIFVFKKE